MISRQYTLLAGIVAVLASIAWFVLTAQTPPGVPEGTETGGNASTTAPTATTSTSIVKIPIKRTLPLELPFVLPEGAVAIDEYAFIQNGTVYFRSLTGKAPLAIPNSEGGSFKRLSNFMTYQNAGVISDCGAAPLYTYYGDRKQVYFYQIWRAPEFRSSMVEVVIGAKTTNFKIIDLLKATDSGRLFEVGYERATTTCKLFLSRSTL